MKIQKREKYGRPTPFLLYNNRWRLRFLVPGRHHDFKDFDFISLCTIDFIKIIRSFGEI